MDLIFRIKFNICFKNARELFHVISVPKIVYLIFHYYILYRSRLIGYAMRNKSNYISLKINLRYNNYHNT